jgi:hypothetical protein
LFLENYQQELTLHNGKQKICQAEFTFIDCRVTNSMRQRNLFCYDEIIESERFVPNKFKVEGLFSNG